MTTDLIITLGATITALVVIVGVAGTFYKIAKRIDAAIGVDSAGRTLSDRLEKVEHQLWENGGSSLADRVNNIEHHVIQLSTEVHFIKDLTLGIHNSTSPNALVKPVRTRKKKAS
jgi:hypothetical protein